MIYVPGVIGDGYPGVGGGAGGVKPAGTQTSLKMVLEVHSLAEPAPSPTFPWPHIFFPKVKQCQVGWQSPRLHVFANVPG